MTTSTSVHSNAFNFMSFLQNGVDPRTGQYTMSISLPDVKTNDLRGPGVPLTLAYNPLNTQDSGFGLGWNLQLSQYTPGDRILSLSTGETFKVTGSDSASGQLTMKEKKLDSFHFYKDSDTHYRVMHKSGLVEILEVRGSAQNPVALPVEMHAPEGHKVTLDYVPFSATHQLLAWIKDDADQTLLTVKRDSVSVEVLLQPFSGPDGGPLARFVMTLASSSKYVTGITLPTGNSASWRFDYELIRGHVCLKKVDTPTGGREDIFYQDTGHQFPTGSGRQALPRVTRHLATPGFDQPPVDVRYTYPDNKNFLGFGLPLSWSDDGLDNLYKYIGVYEYASVEALWIGDKEVRTIERKFNQFHLLTSEATTQNNNVQTVETTYYLRPNVSFEQQDNYCQLPKDNRTTWSMLDNPNRRRSETVSSTYDTAGNLLTQTQANGVVETNTWYPAAGGDGCPPDPEGFVRQLKDKTVAPAPAPNGQAPTLRTRYRYKALPPLAGSPLKNWLTAESQVLLQVAGSNETELERTAFEHTNEPGNAFLHGRIKRQTVTLNSKSTLTDYAYSKLDSPELKESVLQTVETLTGFDHQANGKNVQKIITLQRSLLNGEPLLNRDDNDVEIRYAYDALLRVTRETVAPGTDFEAFRDYEYFLCANAGEQAEQRMFDVKKVKTRTKFDGLNRAIYEERDDADNPTPGSPPRQTYAGTYDMFGNLAEETEFDWDWKGESDLTLTTKYEYDDWGQQRCVTGPNGVKTFEETDPIGTEESQGPIQRSWREGVEPSQRSGVTVTWLNLFEKPTRIERIDLAQQRVSLQQFFYDGLGRTHKEIVGFGEVQRVTQYGYDAFDRLVENTLPNEAVVRRSFAPHSREDLPTLISVEDSVLGEQAFDGLSRRIKAITGGRIQMFDYKPGQTEPSTVTTPSGQVIEYDYTPQLGNEPVLRRLPQFGEKGMVDEAEYVYDKKNARLISCQEQGITLTRDYFSTGEQKSEKRTVGGTVYAMDYRYSRLGNLLDYTDVLRQKQTYRYDAKGLIRTQLGTTLSTFTYDKLGRTEVITTTDSAGGQRVVISLKYDEFDREILREFDLNGVKQQLTQVYNDVDGLTQRILAEGATVLRDESYGYDLRGRLTRYECTGTQPPVDPYGKAITRQVFSFSELDNIRIVITTFAEGSNRATYTYDTVDPAQLRKVTNNHADYPTEIVLEYNADGHLIRDEANRTLDYDALGRLISVSALPGETPGSYSYDPLDTIAGMNDGSGQEQRFYQDGKLANQIKGDNSSTFIRGDDVVLAELKAGADPKSLLLASDMKNSVQAEVSKTGRKDVVYSAYGHRAQDASVSSQLGYNGERREGQTGWYLLGNGYRVYSPGLMRFHSPDSWSPFGEGGVNAYIYCEVDPVNNVDPNGRSIWGNFLRSFRVTTASASASRVPAQFLYSSKQGPATVRPIQRKHVEQLNKIVGLAKRNVGATNAKIEAISKKPSSIAKYERTHNVDFMEDSFARIEQANSSLDRATRLRDWARNNVGKPGITRESGKLLKDEANQFDVMNSEIREANRVRYRDYQDGQMYRKNQREVREMYAEKVKKHYLGDGKS